MLFQFLRDLSCRVPLKLLLLRAKPKGAGEQSIEKRSVQTVPILCRGLPRFQFRNFGDGKGGELRVA